MNIDVKKDGHMHSEVCPHGTKDPMEMYIKEAIDKGLNEITFTEHMPMVMGFYDEELLKEAAPDEKGIEKYFERLQVLKEKYKNDLKINIGLEVDYIEDYEEETKKILNKYIHLLDEGILSVHFIKYNGKHYCLDVIEGFQELFKDIKDLNKIYDIYFETIIKSINSKIGKDKIKRIGHPTLVRIFNKKYPLKYENWHLINKMIKAIKDNDYEVDVNTAGLRKPFCGELYPYNEILKVILESNIKCVYGSDSHQCQDVGYKFETIEEADEH